MFWSNGFPSVRIDVFIAKLSFESAVLESAKEATIYGSRIVVASPEASIIYKLLAHRTKGIADVESLFDTSAAGGRALDWVFLNRWAADWEIEDVLAPYKAQYGSPG